MAASVTHLPRADLPKDFGSILHNLSPLRSSFSHDTASVPSSVPSGAAATATATAGPAAPSAALETASAYSGEAEAPPAVAVAPDLAKDTSEASYTTVSAQNHAYAMHAPRYSSILHELDPEHRFGDEVMAEALRLRAEQEKTRQVYHKVELSHMVLQLMREAAAHGISGELMRRLFVDGDLGDLERAVRRPSGDYAIQTPPSSKLAEEENDKKRRLEKLPPPRQQPLPTSHLQPQQPLQHHLPLHQLPQPRMALHPPLGSPKTLLPPSMVQKAALPPVPFHPQMYPVYYALVPEKTAYEMSVKPEEADSLGLPYMGRNYSTVMYQTLPQYVPQPSLHRMQQPAYFYVNSLQQAMAPSQFLVPPPSGKMMAWPVPAESKEEEPVKRRKLAKNINFMITTPKNPPAKKYNK